MHLVQFLEILPFVRTVRPRSFPLAAQCCSGIRCQPRPETWQMTANRGTWQGPRRKYGDPRKAAKAFDQVPFVSALKKSALN